MTDSPKEEATDATRVDALSVPPSFAQAEPLSCTVLHRRHMRRHPSPVFSRPEGRM